VFLSIFSSNYRVRSLLAGSGGDIRYVIAPRPVLRRSCFVFLSVIQCFACHPGIDEDDNYHTSALYVCLFVWFLVDLVIVMPLSLAAKFTAVSREMEKWRASVAGTRSFFRGRLAGGLTPSPPSDEMSGAAPGVTDNPLRS